MERIQLKDPGDELILHVLNVASSTVDRTDYWLFQGTDKEVRVPASSVKTRLERMKVATAPRLVGKTIRFARSTKTNQGGKPYWEMDLATEDEIKALQHGNGNGSGATSGTPASADGRSGVGTAGATHSPPKSYTDLYLKAMDFVFDKALPKYKTKGFELPPSLVVEIVGTVFDAKVREA